MARLSDVPTAVRTALWVLTARAVLARGGFPGVITRYQLVPADEPEATPPPLGPEARRAADIAYRVSRVRVLGATCLPRSIAIARVVARYGSRTDIVLGVTKLQDFDAHAWVEAGEQRIDASNFPDGSYQPAGRFTLPR